MSDAAQPQQIDVVVVGGGQAGLAVAYELAQRQARYVVLDSEERIGDSWRRRWEGLRLFTPARYDGLPGMSFPAHGWSYPTKDDVADYLAAYAAHFELRVRSGVTVEGVRLATSGGGFLVTSSDGIRWARSVVLATGAFRRPRVPTLARDLDPAIRQVHSSQYRDPSGLLPGSTLLVGASNSGAEIAMTMASGRRVILAGRDTGTMPVRPGSRAARLFDPPFWWFINHVVRSGTWIGRMAMRSVRDRGGPLERVRPADLAAAGVERRFERVTGVESGWPRLEGGEVVEVANIVWCTGFRPDFEWIEVPLRLVDGWPVHRHGVVEDVPGIYLAGMPFQHTGASSLIGGVGRDAALVAEHIVRRGLRAAQIRVTAEAGREPRASAGIGRTS